MSAIILDGKQIAKKIYSEISISSTPKVVFILVGDDKNSIKYLNTKVKKANSLGFDAELKTLKQDISQIELDKTLADFSNNSDINGILLQLPLPNNLSFNQAVKNISPLKDIDGLHPDNLFALVNKLPGLIPCTALGVLELILDASSKLNSNLSSLNAVVIGRSYLVGKPIAQLLENNNITVTSCHSHTKDLEKHLERCDIIVTAVGKKNLIKKVNPNSIVIDVGINYVEGKICGDVDFKNVSKNCAAISPVPGGVGPLTIAMLMKNISKSMQLQGF